MGRSRSRERKREKRPADDQALFRDYDREYNERRDVDYRSSRKEIPDNRERGERDDHREKDRRERSDRDRAPPPSSVSRRSRSRDRDDGRRRKDGERRRERVDEFGRVINFDREKSVSPDRPRRFDPRNLRRSESPEAEQESVVKDLPRHKNEHLFQVTAEDDPETAAAKMELEAMAKMGLPVQLDTSKGKGNMQTDKFATSGAVRIKPQRHARQYMNRRCGFNKPLPAEATRKVYGLGTKELGLNNVSW